MLSLDSVSAFVAIATTASFAAAARQLALSRSVVSERLQDLERSLGAKLVQHTTPSGRAASRVRNDSL